MRSCSPVLVSVCTLLALSAGSTAAAENADDLGNAIVAGKATVAVRYRFEHVDQDGFANNADASTARLRLNYRTGSWRGWSAFGEFDHVFHVLLNDFNSGGGTSPGKGNYPVVADPKGSDLNQFYLDYGSSQDWKVRIGRQRILLDNQRYVGGVGWRQNEQTYDGINFTTDAISRTSLSYSYVGAVRRIFGDDVPAGRHDVDAHLLNAKVTINDDWSVVPYFYYIDNDDVAAFSTSTLGARLAGQFETGDSGELAVVAELATQSDAGNGPISYDAEYLHVDALWSMPSGLSLGIGYESLGGDGDEAGKAFRTPLATLHKFQGWADKFLATPNEGIDDLYITAKYKVSGWNLTAVYHDFSSESGSGDFGTEFDLSAGHAFSKRYGILFKAAFFQGDSPAYTDTNKFWIMLTANY